MGSEISGSVSGCLLSVCTSVVVGARSGLDHVPIELCRESTMQSHFIVDTSIDHRVVPLQSPAHLHTRLCPVLRRKKWSCM